MYERIYNVLNSNSLSSHECTPVGQTKKMSLACYRIRSVDPAVTVVESSTVSEHKQQSCVVQNLDVRQASTCKSSRAAEFCCACMMYLPLKPCRTHSRPGGTTSGRAVTDGDAMQRRRRRLTTTTTTMKGCMNDTWRMPRREDGLSVSNPWDFSWDRSRDFRHRFPICGVCLVV